MSVDIAQRAAARFAELRHLALASTTFDAGQVAAPAGWCISAVARIGQNDPAMLLRLAEVQHALAPVAELYAYAAESLHISLLGCTQREPAVPAGRPSRVRRIREALAAVTAEAHPVPVRLGGVNLIGTQLFVEVLTDDAEWSRLRRELAGSLAAIGEDPLAYADPEPMHLNVARLLTAPDPDLLRQALLGCDLVAGRPVLLHKVELVLTDFVLTPATLEILGAFEL
jgi:hypothetical protein